MQIGDSGQIKAFREERKYGDHRHISHLVGLYPGTLINTKTPAWMKAAKRTLRLRGDRSTGWAMAHRLNAWARSGDGNHAYHLFRLLLKRGTLPNLWDTHPPFQIDGNFGGTSGVAEMLLQSHEGCIRPLAALPRRWKKGRFRGLVARGNFVIDAAWRDHHLTELKTLSRAGEPCIVEYPGITSFTRTGSDGTGEIPCKFEGDDRVILKLSQGAACMLRREPNIQKF